MDIELINKIDELIDIFNNSDEIKRIKTLKENIYKNEKLKEKIERFNKVKENPYSSEYISLKREILEDEEVKEFKLLENELLLLTLSINQKLNTLTKNKRCNNENN